MQAGPARGELAMAFSSKRRPATTENGKQSTTGRSLVQIVPRNRLYRTFCTRPKTIGPGPIATELLDVVNPPDTPRTTKTMEETSVERIGQPEGVTRASSFFLEDGNGHFTGQTLYVCGGLAVGTAPIWAWGGGGPEGGFGQPIQSLRKTGFDIGNRVGFLLSRIRVGMRSRNARNDRQCGCGVI